MTIKKKKELELRKVQLYKEIKDHRDMALRLEGAIIFINEMLENK